MAKALAFVSLSFVIAYLFTSAANPEMSQDIRDGWRRVVDPPPVTATPTTAPTPTPEPPGITDEELTFFRDRLLVLVNEERTSLGLNALVYDDNSAAQTHAEDLMRDCSLGHTGSDGSDVATRYVRAGDKWRAIAENIHREGFCPIRRWGYIDLSFDQLVERAHEGLMSSPGHRANILNLRYQQLALGFAYNRPNFYVVQVFTSQTW